MVMCRPGTLKWQTRPNAVQALQLWCLNAGRAPAGVPAAFLRDMEEGEADFVLQSANNYAALASVHAAENSKTTEEILVRLCCSC